MKLKIFIILALLFSLNPSLALADVWLAPPANPPSSNRPAPVDTSNSGQSKIGSLTVQGGLNVGNANQLRVDASGGLTIPNLTVSGAPSLDFGNSLIYFTANQQSSLSISSSINRNQGLISSVASIMNSNNQDAAHSLYVSNSGDSSSIAIYGVHSGSGWAGYFSGPVGASSYLVVGGAAQGAYAGNGDAYFYDDLGTVGDIIVGGGLSTYDATVADNTVETSQLCLGDGSNCITQWGQAGNSLWTASGNNIYNNNAGNVGIGTASPGYKLDVAGTAQINNIWKFDASGIFLWGSNYGNGILTWDTGYASVQAQSGNSLRLGVSGYSTALNINTSGNVGIGITTPNAKLDVNGDLNVSGLGRADHLWIGGSPNGYDQAGDALFAGDIYVGDTIKIGGGSPGAGKVLTSDANGLASWQTPAAGGAPGGSNTYVQFNNNGAFEGDAGLTYNSATDALTVDGKVRAGSNVLDVGAGTSLFHGNMDINSVGNLLTLQTEGSNKLTVNKDGDILSAGGLSVTGDTLMMGILIVSDGLANTGMTELGSASLNLQSNENLIYGNIDTNSAGNLLLLQNESADKFKVNKDGYAYLANELKVSNDTLSHLEDIASSNQYQTYGGCSCLGGQFNYAPNYLLQSIVKDIKSLFIEEAQAAQCQQYTWWSASACNQGDNEISVQNDTCDGNSYVRIRTCQSNSLTTNYYPKINFSASDDGTQHYVDFGLNTVNLDYQRVSQNCGNISSCGVSCPTGTKVLGGGCDTSGYLRDNYPENDDRTWSCRTTSAAANLTAYAICARIGN